MSRYVLELGDCVERLKLLPDNSVDSIVTDPPYHLTTGKKGGSGAASEHGKASPYGAVSRMNSAGFMGMKWDGGDVAFRVELWAELLRVLKPGGMLVAFGGTRTYHQLATAIEAGGFEVRDMLAWLYGSGFPKGTDKTKIPAAWRGWNTALKPALEPGCFARKPMEGTLWENLERWGTGAIWIDGCRVSIEDDDEVAPGGNGAIPARNNVYAPRTGNGTPDRDPVLGRWPANLMHDGSDEVRAVFPSDAGAGGPVLGSEPSPASVGRVTGKRGRVPGAFHDDSGSAARFFYTPKVGRAERNDGCESMEAKDLIWSSGKQAPGTFQAEGTNRTSQNHHPTVKPTDLMAYLCRLVTPPGGVVLDPFMGSGSTGRGAMLEGLQFHGIELDPEYLDIAKARISVVVARIIEAKRLAAIPPAQKDLFATES